MKLSWTYFGGQGHTEVVASGLAECYTMMSTPLLHRQTANTAVCVGSDHVDEVRVQTAK